MARVLLFWLLLSGLAASAAEPDKVSLQLKWKHQFQFAGYYAAKEKGFYREAGLDVNIVEAETGTDPVSEVAAGRAQFGVGTSELILNRYRGANIRVLGVIFQHSPLSLITLASSGIDHVHKLVDRKVMIEANSAELFAYLYQEGFTPRAFALQHHSQDLNDLLSGETDAMSVYVTDELYELKRQRIAYNQFSPNMSGIDFYGDNFFTLDSELQTKPERVKAFREATLRGWRYAMQNPEELVQLIYQQYSQRHSIEHLRYEAAAMAELMKPDLIDPGYMNKGRWQHIAQTYHQLGLLPENFDVEAMLYFPDSEADLSKLRTTLYYGAVGLALMSLLSVVLFRFYRRASINENRLNTMFEHAPLSLIVLDERCLIKSWNTEAEKTFLWRSSEMLGKNIMSIVAPHYCADVEQKLAEVIRRHKVVRCENLNLRRDGSEILCEWLNAPFQDAKNRANFILCMARDITEQKHLEQQLEQAAHYDQLTSLPNRALILELIKQSLAVAARQKTKLAILFLDLDGFKAVNDRLGHNIGDMLLQATAKRLSHVIRNCDYAGRLAGDEFLVILQDIGGRENAQRVADILQRTIAKPLTLNSHPVTVTASIGISLYPDDADDIDLLINEADQNMYQAKRGELD
ncbi:diguanylate cyclase domain-containing protein [Methylomonas sp. DH-1]|uniref:diguanylate cyclase domain-containing protein n=1 Tax=Methylomonas sp. (strain DH-1) TaxID=1727196 RepID=UPI0007C996C3|nr:diguanylate cyclase [Methylomonas sp. DH-1]ANE53814.1 PAS domain S-box protein [Methylomonas sp. DH-1]